MEKRVHTLSLLTVISILILITGVFGQCVDGTCSYYTNNENPSELTSAPQNPNPEEYHESVVDELINMYDSIDSSKASKEQAEDLLSKGLDSEVKFTEQSWLDYTNGGSFGEVEILDKDGNTRAIKNLEVDSVEFKGNLAKYTLDNGATIEANAGYLQQPKSPGAQAPSSGGGGGGSSGGGGGGGLDEKLQAGLSIVQQLVGLFKEMIPKSNGEGSTKATSNPDGGAKFELDDGAQVYFEDEEKEKEVKLAQNDETQKAVVTVDEGLNNLLAETNTAATIYSQADIYTTPETPPTDIVLNGINRDSPAQISEALALQQQYATPTITASAIAPIPAGQYVKLIQHNIILSGEKILVDLFKSFNEINAKGSNLYVKNGDIEIKFQGKKTYYPRKIKDSPYSIGRITNGFDDENYFKLTKYKDHKGRLIDIDRTVSVGDLVTEHPRESRLKIARNRKNMWAER